MARFVLVLFWTFSGMASFAAPNSEPKTKAVLQEIKDIVDVKHLLYPAKVDAKMTSTVTADLDANVIKIKKNLGAKVKAGEVIMTLENRDPAFTYSSVPVRSPLAGVVSQLFPQVMSKVAKGDKLFTVMNADILQVTAEIPSADLTSLQNGSLGNFESKNGPVPVRVIGISPIIDPRTGTASAEIEFTQKKNLPPVGTIGHISFQIVSGQVILLPENSLSYLEGKPTVRVVDKENRTHRRFVELGEQREDLFVIKSGLKPGERVVIRSAKGLKDGEEIDVQSNDTQ